MEKFPKNLYIRILTVGVLGGLKTKALIPILLHLTRKALQPPALNNLIENREKNRQNRIMEAFIEPLRPRSMHSPAVGTSVSFYPDSFNPAFKISLHIPMPPKPTSITSRTLLRSRPTKIFAFLNQPLYIYVKREYQCNAFCGWSVGTCLL